MRTLRVFHPCLPNYDNLGDIVANEAVRPMFRRRGIDLELVDHDLASTPRALHYLDESIDLINDSFDAMMIGPGGFLGPKLIGSVFQDCRAWQRLTVPLFLNGIGIIGSITRPVWYSSMDHDSPVACSLRRADVVSVRELNTWLLAARVMGQDSSRLMLAGCPSVQIARISGEDVCPPKTYDLALNLSFVHEVCRNYVSGLLELVKAVASRYRRVLWICHSGMDADQAIGVNRELGLGFDVVRPRNALEAGSSYAACERALVTRFHAGIFCLANTVPFNFVGYDVKCWHLISMIADEPHRYILPIDRVSNADAPAELIRMQAHLENNHEALRRAHDLLRTWFGEQTNRFVDAVISKLRPSQSRSRAAEAASQERF
jgi:hypothetical protein